jgi:hypothetical protein
MESMVPNKIYIAEACCIVKNVSLVETWDLQTFKFAIFWMQGQANKIVHIKHGF